MPFQAYHSIENLVKVGEIYSHGPVIVLEKIHGTNFGILFEDDILTIHGRNRDLVSVTSQNEWLKTVSGGEFDSYGLVPFLVKNYPNLYQYASSVVRVFGSVFHLYGEFFGGNIQKGVDYGKEKHIALFDVRAAKAYTNDWRWQGWASLVTVASYLGLPVVPLLGESNPDLDWFKELYETDSEMAKSLGVEKTPNVKEGLVIRPVTEAVDARGNRVIVKFKNNKFTEVASQAKVREPKDPADELPAIEFAESYVTASRVEHAMQHLQEDTGLVCDSMKQTKQVIDAVIEDLRKEAKEELETVGLEKGLRYAAKRAAIVYKGLVSV